MLPFIRWVLKENHSNNVVIDITTYEKQIRAAIDKMSDFSQQQADELEQFQFDPNIIQNSPYPQKQELLNAINNHKPGDDQSEDHLDDHISQLTQWYLQTNRKNYDPNLRNIWKHITNYQAKLGNNWRHDPNYYEGKYKELLQKTQQYMEIVKQKIVTAIQNIPTWSGSPVRIMPLASEDQSNNTYIEDGANDCQIFVGTRYGMFSFFQNEEDGKIIIDDVLEGGYEDEEFFDNDRVKGDYYALINELRKPGSNAKGKILTLYTARPTKDREFFRNTTWLPVNLFLTNSPSHAEGLAHDLGSQEVRDVWLVRMDSKYLVQTLDGPVKYYMVAQDQAPIKSISLY